MNIKALSATTACLTTVALLASGCSGSVVNNQVASDGAAAVSPAVLGLSSGLPTTAGSLANFAALPSAAPSDGYQGGGGGIIGDAWPIWGLPGSRGATDPGISVDKLPVATVLGLQPEFTAVPGQGSYEFKVQDVAGQNTIWDSGDASTNPSCTVNPVEVNCVFPSDKVGTLTNGSTYRLLTIAGGVTTPRLFSVDVLAGATGATGGAAVGHQFHYSGGGGQVGIKFSTADQGPTAGTNATAGPRWGLPAGWEWAGPPSGFITVTRQSNSSEYAGYTELLTVSSSSQTQTLGCQSTGGDGSSSSAKSKAPQAAFMCGAIGGAPTGAGMSALINNDGSVVVISQGSGENWTFNASNQLISEASAGSAPVNFSYRTISGQANPVLATMSIPAMNWTWTFNYSGDSACQDSTVSPGLIAAPTGYACGWTEPSGDQGFILYSQPTGATVPRVSRVVQMPAACTTWQSCDVSQMGVFDIGWDSENRMAYQRQDSSVVAAVLGNISGTDQSYWASYSYDNLNRMASITQPKLKSDVGGTTTSYTYTAATEQWAPATREIVTIVNTPETPTQVSAVAFDDAGRKQYTMDTDGVITQQIWDPDKALQYGTVVGDYSVAGAQYDSFARTTNSWSGVPASFDLTTCSPNAANRSNSSCQPTSSSADAALTQQSGTYDEASGTGTGLRSVWFNNTQFSGNPANTSFIKQDGSNGFAVSAPASAGKQWSAIASGGLALTQNATWNITVEVPSGMFSGATLFLNGSICALVPSGQTQATCTINSDGVSTYPLSLNLAHAAGGKNSGHVVITAQYNEFSSPTTCPAGQEASTYCNFIPTWSATTTSQGTDHSSSGTPIVTTKHQFYSSPITPMMSSETALPTTAMTPASLTTQTDFQTNQFGGVDVTSTTNPGGNSLTTTNWGLTDTPASLPNSSQIPKSILKVAQGGQPKYTTSPSGRQQWHVYDQYGNVACQADVMQGISPVWSCQVRNAQGRLQSSINRSQDGQPDISTTYTYSFDSNPAHSPFVEQTSRTSAGQTVTDETRQWTGGLDDQYIANDGSTTVTSYNPNGSISSSTTYVSVGGSQRVQAVAVAQAAARAASAANKASSQQKPKSGKASKTSPSPTADKSNSADSNKPSGNGTPAKPTPSGTATAAGAPTPDKKVTDSATPTPSKTATDTATPTPSKTVTPTESPTPTATTTVTPSPTQTPDVQTSTTLSYQYTYDDMSRVSSVMQGDKTLATVNYSGSDPRQITGYSYLNGSITQKVQFDQFNRVSGSQWTLPDGTNVENSWTKTAGGKSDSEQFGDSGDTASNNYTYDGYGRLIQSANQVAGVTHDFSYGWDEDNNRTCAASDIANPDGKACSALTGATTFTYKNDQLTASSSPATSIPAGSILKDGSFSAVGDQSYQFDASRQLDYASISGGTPPTSSTGNSTAGPTANSTGSPILGTPTAQQVSFMRDAQNRILAQTTTSTAGTTQSFNLVYGASNDSSPVASVSGDTVTPLVSLPGNLLLQGSTPIIRSVGGLAALTLNADGSKGSNKTQSWGPYGEDIVTNPSLTNMPNSGWFGTNDVLDGNLINLGARAYRTDLGMFLQPDPFQSGSGTLNDHAYVAGDPINESDLSGTMSTWAQVGGNLLSMIIEFPVLDGAWKLADMLPERFWTFGGGSLGKSLSFAINAGVNLGMTVALDAALTGGSNPNNMSPIAIVFAGVTAAVSGYMGSTFSGVSYRGLTLFQRIKKYFGLDPAPVQGPVQRLADGTFVPPAPPPTMLEQLQATAQTIQGAVADGRALMQDMRENGILPAVVGPQQTQRAVDAVDNLGTAAKAAVDTGQAALSWAQWLRSPTAIAKSGWYYTFGSTVDYDMDWDQVNGADDE